MTKWRVLPDVKRFMLQSTLNELTALDFDIYEITYIQPLHEKPNSYAHGSAGIGDFYCVIAVKY